jgi:flavin reductase (DIM6/NTAB) family NADH-FMN oxidoreductase RutF
VKGNDLFYTTEAGHPLPHNPFKAIVSPRPIGWISTRGSDGRDNLAPYSFFNAVADNPPQVVFSSTSAKQDRGDTKDTVANIRDTGVFCVNIVSYALRDAMNRSSGPWGRDVDEFTDAQLAKAPCETIPCARVAAAPAALECRLISITQLKGDNCFMVLGEVSGTHIADDCIIDGRLDVTRYQPLARLGYRDYARVEDVFALNRPGD